MLKKYSIIEQKIVENDDEKSSILVYINPDEKERKNLIEEYEIDEHTLQSALDLNELSRLEFEPSHLALIFKRPKNYSSNDQLVFKTSTMGIFYFGNRIIILSPDEYNVFEGKIFNKVDSILDIMLKLMSQAINHFMEHIKVINMITEELEHKINKSLENKYLLNLFAIGKSLIFYLNAIDANSVLINKLKRYSEKINFNEEQQELLDDITIENNQCYRQAEIYSSILTGMMDVRASIVNNNMNVLMKQLTIISIVFMPLNLLAGIGGMSEFSMMTVGIDWKLSYSLFLFAMVVVGYVTYYIIQKVGMSDTLGKNSFRKKLTVKRKK